MVGRGSCALLRPGHGQNPLGAQSRALSAANSCLYGVCHAAIVSAGYSPAIGFIHTGKMLSFVYDIADLYKAEMTILATFRAAAVDHTDLESRVRRECRDTFNKQKLLQRIVPDIEEALVAGGEATPDEALDADATMPGGLWDPEDVVVAGGANYADGPRLEVVDGSHDA